MPKDLTILSTTTIKRSLTRSPGTNLDTQSVRFSDTTPYHKKICKTHKIALNIGVVKNFIALFQNKRPKKALFGKTRCCPDILH